MELPIPPNKVLERAELLGRILVLHWADAHRSELMLDAVRRACPCASCGGSGAARGPGLQMVAPSGKWEVQAIQVVGRYALQLSWRDGHDTGIYSFELLRSLCECVECNSGGGSDAPE
jgi:DUF971 family protein